MLPASAGLRCAPQNVAVAVTGGRSEKACRWGQRQLQRSATWEKRKPRRLDGVSPYRSVLPKISLVGRRSAEPQKDNFPIYPQQPQNS